MEYYPSVKMHSVCSTAPANWARQIVISIQVFETIIFFQVNNDERLSSTTILDSSGPGSNVNEGVLHTPQSSQTETTPPNAF